MVVARRSRPALVLSLLVSGMVLSSSAASAGAPDRRPALPRGATDITDTAKGQKLIREAKGRYAEAGHKAGELRAVKDATGILIAPVDTTFDTYAATLADGSTVAALAPLTADDPAWVQEQSSAAEVSALAAPAWKFVTTTASASSTALGQFSTIATTSTSLPTMGPVVRLVCAPSVRDGEPQLAVGARPRTNPGVSKRRLLPEMG